MARNTQGKAPADNQTEMWKLNRYDYAVYVTNLDKEAINAWQVMGLYRDGRMQKTSLAKSKTNGEFNGFMSAKKAVSALAAQLLLLVYNLWNLYMRLVEPGKHTEAVTSRRWLLLMVGRLVQ